MRNWHSPNSGLMCTPAYWMWDGHRKREPSSKVSANRILVSVPIQRVLPKGVIQTPPYLAMDRRVTIVSDAESRNFRTGDVFYLSERPTDFRKQFFKAQEVRMHSTPRTCRQRQRTWAPVLYNTPLIPLRGKYGWLARATVNATLSPAAHFYAHVFWKPYSSDTPGLV